MFCIYNNGYLNFKIKSIFNHSIFYFYVVKSIFIIEFTVIIKNLFLRNFYYNELE